MDDGEEGSHPTLSPFPSLLRHGDFLTPLPPSFHYLHFLFLTDAAVGFGAFVPSPPSTPSTPLPLPALLVYLCTQILA